MARLLYWVDFSINPDWIRENGQSRSFFVSTNRMDLYLVYQYFKMSLRIADVVGVFIVLSFVCQPSIKTRFPFALSASKFGPNGVDFGDLLSISGLIIFNFVLIYVTHCYSQNAMSLPISVGSNKIYWLLMFFTTLASLLREYAFTLLLVSIVSRIAGKSQYAED